MCWWNMERVQLQGSKQQYGLENQLLQTLSSACMHGDGVIVIEFCGVGLLDIGMAVFQKVGIVTVW